MLYSSYQGINTQNQWINISQMADENSTVKFFLVFTEHVPTFTNKNTLFFPLVSSQVNRMLESNEVSEQQLVMGGHFDVPDKVNFPLVSMTAYFSGYISPFSIK